MHLPNGPKKHKSKKKKAGGDHDGGGGGGDDGTQHQQQQKRRKVNFALSPLSLGAGGRGPHYRRKFVVSFGINRYATAGSSAARRPTRARSRVTSARTSGSTTRPRS